jgi:hypothetical protein
MFALSLALWPFNQTWSVITILALVTLWSRIPGFVHFIFNKLALNDLFAFIVAVEAGWLVGGLFGAWGIWGARVFGREWTPYSIRASIAVFAAAAATPVIVTFTGGLNVIALYLFEVVLYAVYYALVVLFWKSEIGLEVMILPAVLFFDFAMNGFLVGLFGNTIENMLSGGLTSGWPFLVFGGVVVAYAILARNGVTVADLALKLKGKRTKKAELRKVLAYDPAKGVYEEIVDD